LRDGHAARPPYSRSVEHRGEHPRALKLTQRFANRTVSARYAPTGGVASRASLPDRGHLTTTPARARHAHANGQAGRQIRLVAALHRFLAS
jgi:hypothetical protein